MSENISRYSPQEALDLLLTESALKGVQRTQRYPHQRFFGYFCSYFPEELILAAGLHPLRLFPTSENSTPAELPAYCCSLARGTLEMQICQLCNDLLGVGFTHTCDTMQCLSGIWASSSQGKTVDLVPPVMLSTSGAAGYYYAELKALIKNLEQLTDQKITDQALGEALMLCARARELVSIVDALRPQLPSPTVSALIRAGQLMPRSDYCLALEACLPLLREMAAESGAAESRAKILVSSAVLENDSLFAMIEDLGGRVVADDTCTGYRHFAGQTPRDKEDPLRNIVKRYSEMPPCPCKNRSLNERSSYLTGLAKQRQVQGAIIVIRKYCEPHAWDAVHLAENFRRDGIRTLTLELEGANVGGQERTRLQAFLESLTENPGFSKEE